MKRMRLPTAIHKIRMEGVEGGESETIAPDVVLNINPPWPPFGRIVGEGVHLNSQVAHSKHSSGLLLLLLFHCYYYHYYDYHCCHYYYYY